jgi:hypothetical protein
MERAEPIPATVIPAVIATPATPAEETKSNGALTGSTEHPIQTTTNTTETVDVVPMGGVPSSEATTASTSESTSAIPSSTPSLISDPAATKPAETITASADVLDTSDLATPLASKQEGSEFPLGGNEKEGAHETGQLFPRVIRHDTNMSISKLHVPGEFK